MAAQAVGSNAAHAAAVDAETLRRGERNPEAQNAAANVVAARQARREAADAARQQSTLVSAKPQVGNAAETSAEADGKAAEGSCKKDGACEKPSCWQRFLAGLKWFFTCCGLCSKKTDAKEGTDASEATKKDDAVATKNAAEDDAAPAKDADKADKAEKKTCWQKFVASLKWFFCCEWCCKKDKKAEGSAEEGKAPESKQA